MEGSCTEFSSKSSLCTHAGVALNVTTLSGCVSLPGNQILHNFSWTVVCASAQESLVLVRSVQASVMYFSQRKLPPGGHAACNLIRRSILILKRGMDSSMERDHYKLKRLLSASTWLIQVLSRWQPFVSRSEPYICKAAVAPRHSGGTEVASLSVSLSAACEQYNSEVR